MQVIILAAGTGTRLRPITDDRPKCMVELAGEPLIGRQLRVFRGAGIERITVVAGYRADRIEAPGAELVLNQRFASTNMVHTLFCAAERFGDEDLIVSYGDIVFEPRVLQALIASTAPVLVVIDSRWRDYWGARMAEPLADAETLKLDGAGRILELGRKPRSYAEIQGQYIGLIRFSREVLGELKALHAGMDRTARYDGKDFDNMYMTSFLQYLIDAGWEVRAVPVENGWLEVDTLEDLDLYRRLHAAGELGRFYDGTA